MTATQLRTTQLRETGFEITRLGVGAWAIGGGGWEHGWGPQDDEESIAAIHRALERAINWIDTAAAYGFGRSEQIVGPCAGRRRRATVRVYQVLAAGRSRPNGRAQSEARLDSARG
jgi:aryl-alcohol dehydrogenase-like predicted oxidoreductase